MGSYISVLNDTSVPVTVYFRSHGGAVPATPDGEHRMTLAPDQENKAGFNLSYALVIYCEWKEPGSTTQQGYLNNFSPPTNEGVTSVTVSQIIGSRLPELKITTITEPGWFPVHSISNDSNAILPSVAFKTHFGITDTSGNREKVDAAVTAFSSLSFKGVFDVSVSKTFGESNEEWITKALTQYSELSITIPEIPNHHTLIIEQQQAHFSFIPMKEGYGFADTLTVTGQDYKFRTEEITKSSKPKIEWKTPYGNV